MVIDLPDPIDFSLGVLAARGALVERDPLAGMALLPPELAHSLGVVEELRLSPRPNEEGARFCGLGAPLLEQIIALAQVRAPVVRVRLEGDPPRRAQAEYAAAKLTVRNGLCELLDIGPAHAIYVLAIARYVAEADDRYEGMIPIGVEAMRGAAPAASVLARLDPARLHASDRASPPLAPSLAQAIARSLNVRAPLLLEPALAPIQESVARRQARDYARIAEYYATLIGEARSPRRATAREAIAAKVAQLIAERDQKLRDLAARYAIRVSIAPIGFVIAEARVAEARLRLRRRKGECGSRSRSRLAPMSRMRHRAPAVRVRPCAPRCAMISSISCANDVLPAFRADRGARRAAPRVADLVGVPSRLCGLFFYVPAVTICARLELYGSSVALGDVGEALIRIRLDRLASQGHEPQQPLGSRTHRLLLVLPARHRLGPNVEHPGEVLARPAEMLTQEADLCPGQARLLLGDALRKETVELRQPRHDSLLLAALRATAELQPEQHHVGQPRLDVDVVAVRDLHLGLAALGALHFLILQAVTTRSSLSERNATTKYMRDVRTRYRHDPPSDSAGSTTPPRSTFSAS